MLILLKCINPLNTDRENVKLSDFEIIDSIPYTTNLDIINEMVFIRHDYTLVYKLYDSIIPPNGIYPLYNAVDWTTLMGNATLAAILVNGNHPKFRPIMREVIISSIIT